MNQIIVSICMGKSIRTKRVNLLLQYSVTLQSDEHISEECRKRVSQGSAVTSYVRHQETCLHTLKSHFSLPVPLTATPGFITDIGLFESEV